MIDMTSHMLNRISDLNNESQRIAYQMSTGKVLDNGSDDSILYSQVLNIEDKIRKYDGLENQLNKTVSQNNVSDSSMDEIKLSLDTLKADILKSLNEGMDSSSKGAIAVNIEGIRENLFQVVNTKVDGEYLFSGSDTTKEAFIKDAAFVETGKVNLGGDAILRTVTVDANVYRERGITAYDVLMYNTDTAGKDEQLNFYENESIIDENGQEWKMNGAKTAIQQYDKSGILTNPAVEITITNDGATPTKYTTDSGQITGTKFLEAKHNFFDDLNVMINALKGYSTDTDPASADFGKKNGSITDDQIEAITRTLLETTSQQYDSTNIAHAELGGRNRIIEIANESVAAKQVHYNILLQETNGADMSRLALESKSLEMTYQALYSTVSKMHSLSLLNYMN